MNGARCRRCDAVLPNGARYCTACGERVRGIAHLLPWLVAAGAVLALLFVLLFPSSTHDADAPTPTLPAAGAGASTSAAGPGPLTGTPREQADRLFNRIMQEREAGDTARAAFFLPMAIDAYGMAGELDADGHYHRGLLYLMAGDAGGAQRTAQAILADAPDHVFGRALAAQAALLAADSATARSEYQRLLDGYASESTRERPEYQDHPRMLEQHRDEARSFLAR